LSAIAGRGVLLVIGSRIDYFVPLGTHTGRRPSPPLGLVVQMLGARGTLNIFLESVNLVS